MDDPGRMVGDHQQQRIAGMGKHGSGSPAKPKTLVMQDLHHKPPAVIDRGRQLKRNTKTDQRGAESDLQDGLGDSLQPLRIHI